MDLLHVLQRIGIAVGLGLLVGLQREYATSQLAGIRTFPVITVLGSFCALLAGEFGGWVLAAGAVGLAAIIVSGNLLRPRDNNSASSVGLTTEAAAMLMFMVGAYLMSGHIPVAVVVSGGLAVLLQWKQPLHGFVRRIKAEDIRAIMQFVLVTLVILPILPDEDYGPYLAFNPHKTWLMVVLIVAISLGGYVAYQWFGHAAGAVLGGILGGLVSSTATTVSYARRARMNSDQTQLATVVIVIASAVSLYRMVSEMIVVAPNAAWQLVPPVLTLAVGFTLVAGFLCLFLRNGGTETDAPRNPAELRAALVFGALYAVVTLGVAAAKSYYGDRGLYAVAIVSGVHDIDAITLSTSQMVQRGELDPQIAWRVMLSAALSNLVTKAALTGILGQQRLFWRIALWLGLGVAGGIAIIWLWPEAWVPDGSQIDTVGRLFRPAV